MTTVSAIVLTGGDSVDDCLMSGLICLTGPNYDCHLVRVIYKIFTTKHLITSNDDPSIAQAASIHHSDGDDNADDENQECVENQRAPQHPPPEQCGCQLIGI